MFDFASDYRSEANEPGLNTKGLVTFDRSLKKDAFYFYKASWSKEPVVYIASRRYTNLPQASTTIRVYSNQAALKLTLNGAALPTPTPVNGVFAWTGVAWAAGSNVVKVTASSCASTSPLACSDEVTWTK
jgi:beta-galactosidase